MRFAAGSATDVGQVRSLNEDSLLVADGLFAVADGMGGHRGGEVASAAALAAFRRAIADATPDSLISGVEEANLAVYRQAVDDVELSGMGTTLCAIAPVVTSDGVELIGVVNVGDSRVYLLSGDEFAQLSEDHSLVETMVRGGQLTPEQAASHPKRNVLTRALGIEPVVDVDCWGITPVDGDRFLLCSDGLFNELSTDEIVGLLASVGDPAEAALRLVEAANAAGGRDNVTCLVVDVEVEGPVGAAPPADPEPGDPRPGEVEGPPADPAPAIASRLVRISEVVDDPLGLGASDGAEPSGSARPRAGGGATATATATAGTRTRGPLTPAGASAPRTTSASRGASAGRPVAAPPSSHPFTWRVGLFVLAIVAVILMAVGAVYWTARQSYYVGVDHQEVVIYRGRKGGLLWFGPTIDARTGLRTLSLTDAAAKEVYAGKSEPDRGAADSYVAGLRVNSTTTTTTTTVPAPTIPTTTTTPVPSSTTPGG